MWTPDETFLMVIDVQERLMNVMPHKDQLADHLGKLIRGVQTLGLPVVVTEQAPDKLGGTISQIAGLIRNFHPLAKRSFSCCGSEDAMKEINSLRRKRVLICGVETHVCVYQTVSDLTRYSFDVRVVANAVASRKESDREIGLERIRAAGASLTTIETILCEFLRSADHPQFKPVMGLIK